MKKRTLFKLVWTERGDDTPMAEYFFDLQSAFTRGIQIMTMKNLDVELYTVVSKNDDEDYPHRCNMSVSI